MSSKQIKNTRLFYNDEKNLKIYQALSAEDFKELFMACLTYKVGSDVEITDFSSPSLYGLFMMYKDKIDYNETKWLNSGNASRENGKKGGRPKKQKPIEPNDDFKVDTPIEEENNIPCNVEQQEEHINNPKPEEDMGNLTNIVIVDGKAMIKEPVIETRSYSKAQIETIKQKLIDKNTPKQEPVTTTHEKPELSFQDFVNEYKYQINDIIKDFADGTRLRRTQGEERLKSVINSRAGRYYEKQLMTLIENNVLKLTA